MNHILMMSDDSILVSKIRQYLPKEDIKLIHASSLSEGIECLHKQRFNLILITVPLLLERCPEIIYKKLERVGIYGPVIFISDQLSMQKVIKLIKLGVENCFVAPFDVEQLVNELIDTIHYFSKKNLPNSYQPPSLEEKPSKQYIRSSPSFIKPSSIVSTKMYEQIDLVADTNFNVIIYGETGTGKESVAQFLTKGRYHDKPFVAIDCGCLNKDLALSELFGHKKGSFTGAIQDQQGAFEYANGGTIFLDEIANLDYEVQILLLRAIQEKKIKRIGDHKEIEVNCRIIVASNEQLKEAVRKNKFREDLFYRLNEFEIHVPPLRERIEEIPEFIELFLKEMNNHLGKNIKGMSESLLEDFKMYSWPGNIRQLKNVIKRGALMATEYIDHQCMSKDFLEDLNKNISNAIHSNSYKKHEMDELKASALKAEINHILKVLQEENFNKSKTAKRLKIDRKTLYNKLKHLKV